MGYHYDEFQNCFGCLISGEPSNYSTVVVTAKTKTEISELRQTEVEEDYLENEWRNLLLEEETLAEHSKVRDVAENQLNMTRPDANNEEHVEIE